MMTQVRKALPEDTSFIYSSWLNHQRDLFPNRIIPGRMYFKGESYRLDRLLEKTNVYVATPAEDTSQILAWICATTSPTLIIHYAFTKPTFRRLKLFNNLLTVIDPNQLQLNEDIPITRISKELLSYGMLHKYKFVFNPYLEEKILRL